MLRSKLLNSAGLLLVTLACWLYGLHLYRSANRPLADKSLRDSHNAGSTGASTAGSQTEVAAPRGALNKGAPGADQTLDDSSDEIFTFVHASDLHISKYTSKGGYVHFLHFLRTAVPLVSPRLVTITGDLTDGKDQQRLTSLQQIEEWEAYQRALDEFGLKHRFNGTFYRDQRGNHDCFNVFRFDSQENYFRNYSAMGTDGYLLQIKEPFGTYSFVASDGCPKHGFARPLNFFGYLDAYDMEQLERRMELAIGSNHTFLLNHYPVSTMLYGKYNKPFGQLVSNVSVFLCGHLHQLVGGIGAQLQAYKAHDGYWELEIGDMKDHALYRVYAIDHDLVSFVDVTLPLPEIPLSNPSLLGATVQRPIAHPPIILVTNPKDARYLLPRHEPLERMRTSKFIRALIWADKPVVNVTIKIDGNLHERPATYKGRESSVGGYSGKDDRVKIPLWVSPWDAKVYDDGKLHEIEVTAVDEDGKWSTVRIPFHFTTDLVSLENDARGGWIMRQNFPDIFRVSGIVTYLLMCVLLVILPRLYYTALKDPSTWMSQRSLEHHKDEARIAHIWAALTRGDIASPLTLAKLLLATVGARTKFLVSTQFTAQVHFAGIAWLFWPSYAFAMGLAVAPLFTGQLIPSAGSSGAGSVYMYGIYIAGEWAPLLDSWTYALTSIISLAVLLVYLPVAVTPASCFYSPKTAGSRPWYRSIAVRLLVLAFIAIYLGIPTLMTVYTYGPISLVCGFGRAWITAAATAALYVLDWRFAMQKENDYARVSTGNGAGDADAAAQHEN
ncbi:Metallo-dependent phosphatase [Martensiomyces pterosporus]|nr:Metallo-dependent phosphatase [Martensiomyces pterosporus]